MSPIETVAKGDGSRIVVPHQVIARDEPDWQALWAAHAGPDVPAPPVDFETRMVAAAFAGERPSPGADVTIARTRRDGAALELVIHERTPEPPVGAQVLIAPFHIVTLPRYDGPVRFSDGSLPPGALLGALPKRRHEPAPSSTGLSPQSAAALAYLAGPFSGALLLGTEQSSRFVRFHAWQALLGLGALGVAAALFLALAFMLLVVSPTAFWTMLWLSAITALVWLVVWALCLLHAYKGRLWKLPIAGRFAERLALGAHRPTPR